MADSDRSGEVWVSQSIIFWIHNSNKIQAKNQEVGGMGQEHDDQKDTLHQNPMDRQLPDCELVTW